MYVQHNVERLEHSVGLCYNLYEAVNRKVSHSMIMTYTSIVRPFVLLISENPAHQAFQGPPVVFIYAKVPETLVESPPIETTDDVCK